VAGPLCESGDVFTQQEGAKWKPACCLRWRRGLSGAARYRGLRRVDVLNYNSRPLLPEVLFDNGKARLIRRRQTIQELLALELIKIRPGGDRLAQHQRAGKRRDRFDRLVFCQPDRLIDGRGDHVIDRQIDRRQPRLQPFRAWRIVKTKQRNILRDPQPRLMQRFDAPSAISSLQENSALKRLFVKQLAAQFIAAVIVESPYFTFAGSQAIPCFFSALR
jgi:hypothetical protein